jgi:hypothetical protein
MWRSTVSSAGVGTLGGVCGGVVCGGVAEVSKYTTSMARPEGRTTRRT